MATNSYHFVTDSNVETQARTHPSSSTMHHLPDCLFLVHVFTGWYSVDSVLLSSTNVMKNRRDQPGINVLSQTLRAMGMTMGMMKATGMTKAIGMTKAVGMMKAVASVTVFGSRRKKLKILMVNAVQTALRQHHKPGRKLRHGGAYTRKRMFELDEEKAHDKRWQRNIYLVSQSQSTGSHGQLSGNDRDTSEMCSKSNSRFPLTKLLITRPSFARRSQEFCSWKRSRAQRRRSSN